MPRPGLPYHVKLTPTVIVKVLKDAGFKRGEWTVDADNRYEIVRDGAAFLLSPRGPQFPPRRGEFRTYMKGRPVPSEAYDTVSDIGQLQYELVRRFNLSWPNQ